MSLTPCRFFAQGTCRYGNNCRFYHGQPNSGSVQGNVFGNRPLAPATFQPQQQAAVNMSANRVNQNLDIIVETVKKDMQEWQHSGIWPFSCYGPVGAKPSIPGFEDVSPEEHRYNFLLNGCSVPPALSHQLQNMMTLRMNYQQSTQENRNIIERIATATTPGAVTSHNTASTIFGGGGGMQPTTASTSIFGGSGALQPAPAANSIFGGSSVVQPAAPTSSIFGGSGGMQPSAPTTGLFGGSTIQSPSGSGGIFGGTPSGSQGMGNLFGQFSTPTNTVTSNNNVFQNQQQSTFGTMQPGNGAFGQNVFGQSSQVQQSTNLFQQPAPAPAGFFQQPNLSGGFQQQPSSQATLPAPSIFPKVESQTFAQQNTFSEGGLQSNVNQAVVSGTTSSPSIFGGATGNNPLMMENKPPVLGFAAAPVQTIGNQKGVYTEESELSSEELEAFRAQEFTHDTIPTRPPPKHLCV